MNLIHQVLTSAMELLGTTDCNFDLSVSENNTLVVKFTQRLGAAALLDNTLREYGIETVINENDPDTYTQLLAEIIELFSKLGITPPVSAAFKKWIWCYRNAVFKITLDVDPLDRDDSIMRKHELLYLFNVIPQPLNTLTKGMRNELSITLRDIDTILVTVTREEYEGMATCKPVNIQYHHAKIGYQYAILMRQIENAIANMDDDERVMESFMEWKSAFYKRLHLVADLT